MDMTASSPLPFPPQCRDYSYSYKHGTHTLDDTQHDTVYTTSMDPGSGELVTRVAVTAAQRQAGRKQYGGIRVRNSGRSSGATRQ